MITSERSIAAGLPIRPARLWYWVAGALAAGAVLCIASGVAGLVSLDRQVAAYQRVPVPGQGVVAFAQPGRYALYLEQPGHCCSFSESSGAPADGSDASVPFPNWSINLSLRPAGGGPPVAMSDSQTQTLTYAAAGHQGQSATSFTISQPGRYVLTTGNATPASITDVAVGRSAAGGAFAATALLLAGLLVLTPAGVVTGVVTAVGRRRARRRMAAAQDAPAYGWAPTGGASGVYPPGGYPPAPPTYLDGRPAGFGEAIKQAFRNGFVYQGRASRSAFWWFMLFLVLADAAVELLFLGAASRGGGAGIAPVFAVVFITSIYLTLVTLALAVRRLHDTSRSGWWVLITFVPFAGVIILLIFLLLEGTSGPNRYQFIRNR